MTLKDLDEIVWFKVAEKVTDIDKNIIGNSKESSPIISHLRNKIYNGLFVPLEMCLVWTETFVAAPFVVDKLIFGTFLTLQKRTQGGGRVR